MTKILPAYLSAQSIVSFVVRSVGFQIFWGITWISVHVCKWKYM